MDYVPKVESGLQLFARLLKRPVIENLKEDIFFEGLSNTSLVEIVGSVSRGKNHMLTQLIAKFILLKCKVLLINTENHFQIQYLMKLVQNKSLLLENLRIFNCYDHHELISTLSSLDNVFVSDKQISLLAIDSIGAYFWQQQSEDSKLGISSYDFYLKKLLDIVKTSTVPFRVCTVYTRSSDFESKRGLDRIVRRMVTYQLKIEQKSDTNDCLCNIFTSKNTKQFLWSHKDFINKIL